MFSTAKDKKIRVICTDTFKRTFTISKDLYQISEMKCSEKLNYLYIIKENNQVSVFDYKKNYYFKKKYNWQFDSKLEFMANSPNYFTNYSENYLRIFDLKCLEKLERPKFVIHQKDVIRSKMVKDSSKRYLVYQDKKMTIFFHDLRSNKLVSTRRLLTELSEVHFTKNLEYAFRISGSIVSVFSMPRFQWIYKISFDDHSIGNFFLNLSNTKFYISSQNKNSKFWEADLRYLEIGKKRERSTQTRPLVSFKFEEFLGDFIPQKVLKKRADYLGRQIDKRLDRIL